MNKQTTKNGGTSDNLNSLVRPSIEGWGLFNSEGIFHKDEIGLGLINGVNFESCCQLLEELKDGLEDFFTPEKKVEGLIEFKITNLSWDDGQMTFPETGQWDYPPHWEYDIDWEYDIELTETEYFAEEPNDLGDSCRN